VIGTAGSGAGSIREVGVGNIAGKHLDTVGDLSGPGSIHRPHRQPATRKLVDQRQPDGTGTEHDVDVVHGGSFI
jgi:hypothetical protein